MPFRAPILLWLALAACAAPAGQGPADPDACGASALQHLVGKTEAALAATALPAGALRVIRPGMAVTMEYSPQRLNIELDETGHITRVFCG